MPTPDRIECPKCHSRMQCGYLLEQGHGNTRSITTWAEGEPQESFWTGLKRAPNTLRTRTYRCTGCGYLESYALADPG